MWNNSDQQALLDFLQAFTYGSFLVFIAIMLRTAKKATVGARKIDHIQSSETLDLIFKFLLAAVIFLVLRFVGLLLMGVYNIVQTQNLFLISDVLFAAASGVFYALRVVVIACWLSILLPRYQNPLMYISIALISLLSLFLAVRTALICIRTLSPTTLTDYVMNWLLAAGSLWDVTSAIVFLIVGIAGHIGFKRSCIVLPNGLLDTAAKLAVASFVISALSLVFCKGPCSNDPNHSPDPAAADDGAVHIIAILAELPPTLFVLIGVNNKWLRHYKHYAQSDMPGGLELLAESAWQRHLQSVPPKDEDRDENDDDNIHYDEEKAKLNKT